MAPDLDQHDSVLALADEGEIVKAAATALRQKRPLKNARLREAAEALQSGRADEADRLLSKYLALRPNDPGALFLARFRAFRSAIADSGRTSAQVGSVTV